MLNQIVIRRGFVFAAMLCTIFPTSLLAQTRTLTRVYDPIVVPAGQLAPLVNDTIGVYSAYYFCTPQDSFVPARFQIDEVNAKGDYLREKDAIADSNDEVVFMPRDAGDRVATDRWVEGSENTRIELEVTDPLTGEKAWLYLFRNVKNPQLAKPYLRYHRGPSEKVGADTLFAESYVEAHDTTGWFVYTAITQEGDGQNILDRQKVRVSGRFGILNITLNEQEGLRFVGINQEIRPVRGFRELSVAIMLFGAPLDTASFVTQYFPFSSKFGAKNATIPVFPGLTVNEIRQSVDFNAHAVGMTFFNAFNRNGIPVDGVNDTPITTITDPPDGLNWYMVTGNPGTYLVLMNVPLLGTSRALYYKDDATVDNNDTGDKKSYGDSGLLIKSTTNITGSFSFDFTTYYLGKNQTVAVGDQFKQYTLNPLQVTAIKQTRTTSTVAASRQPPTDFGLQEARPNPFSPQNGNVRIGFNHVPNNAAVSLRIFNLLGQEVTRFNAGDLRQKQEIFWDGRDRFGRLLPAGVYFYELGDGRQRAVKKLILLR